MQDLPDTVIGVTMSGQVSGNDYRTVLIPAIEASLARHATLRLLCNVGPDFQKFTTTAFWDDPHVGLYHLTGFERIAIVTDVEWLTGMAGALGTSLAAELKIFAAGELDEARSWISA